MKTLAQEGWVLKPNITKSHSELLDTDLAHVGAKIIPADFASVTIIDGPKIFQFKRVKDVSHTKISHENGSNKSMFRITLSDGNSTCSAMNLQPIPGLSGKVYPGTKFRIKSGGAQVLGGFLLLTPANCEVIGGRVEKLVENIEKNENISKRKSGEDGGPPKFVPFGSSANNGTAKLQVTLEKPGKQETDIQNGAGSNKTGDHDRNSRNDKNNSDRGQKGDYQKDRRGKSYEKRGQSTRSTHDHKGQSYSTDAQGSDDRGRNRNRGTHKSDFRGSSRGNYHNDDNQSNRDRSEDGSQGSGRSRGRGRDRGEDDSHSSGRSRGRGRNKGGDSGRSRGRGRDRGDDSYSSDRSRGRDRGSRGKDRSGRDDHFISDRTQTPGFSLGDVLGDFPALGGASQTGGPSQAIEAVNPASEWSNSRGDGGSGGYEDRGGSRGKFRGNSRDRSDDDSGRSRGRGRGRGRDRDDYSPERARPTNFSLGDVMQDLDFPALGSDSPASGAGQAREEVQSGSDWSNSRDGGGSRGYDDRDGRDNRSRGRGRGSRDRGSRDRGGRGSRRDDYSSGQSKPAVYKADLESDFPSLGGGIPAPAAAPAATNISTKSKGPASKNITNVMVDDEGFEIHDHLLYEDNGPPRQMHDPSFHEKQGYSSYRSSSDQLVEEIREMTVSDNMPSHSGKDRASHGGGSSTSSARASKSQDSRRKDPEKRSDQKFRSGGHGGDSQQCHRGYGHDNSSRRVNDHYDQQYDNRSDQRRDDRYDQRDSYRNEQRNDYRNDRYDDSSNIQYTDRRDDSYNPGRTTSNRSNLTGNRGRSSGGGYRR